MDYPLNPVAGQQVTLDGRAWVWNATTTPGTWDLVPVSTSDASTAAAAAQQALASVAKFTATPPVSPLEGAEWVNPADGREYKWHVGAQSSQWIETGAVVGIPSQTAAALALTVDAVTNYDGVPLLALLDTIKTLAGYSALRAYTGRAKIIRLTDLGVSGYLSLDSADTTTVDNGGTVLVDAAGRRWKRTVQDLVEPEWFGARADTGVNDAAAFTAAIGTGYGLRLKKGVYSIDRVNYYWGDSGSEAIRVWEGTGSVIKGISATAQDCLLDIAGQNLRIRGIEFQGKGSFDTTYASLLRFHTRANAVALDSIWLDNVRLRFNGKAVIYGLAADTSAKVSEVFWNNCAIVQCQRLFDIQGPNYVDLKLDTCYLSQSTPATPAPLENYIFKMPNGTVSLTGCHVMATGLNGSSVCGPVAYFPTGSNNAELFIAGGILEMKRGFRWADNATGTVRLTGNANGYWGSEYLAEALVETGVASKGGVSFENLKLSHSYGQEPLFINAANSPDFKIQISPSAKLTSRDHPTMNFFEKIIGGLWGFPNTTVALLYGYASSPAATGGARATVQFATDWISSSHVNHRFKGAVAAGVFTVPREGLCNTGVEVLADWTDAAATVKLTRKTTLACNALASGYVGVTQDLGIGGNLFERGVFPGARVYTAANVFVGTIIPDDFGNGAFKLSAAFGQPTGPQNLQIETDIATLTKAALTTREIGDLWPGDQLYLSLISASTATNVSLSHQSLRIFGSSRLRSLELAGVL